MRKNPYVILCAIVAGVAFSFSIATPSASVARSQSDPAPRPDLSGHWVLQPDPAGADVVSGGTGVVMERRPAKEITLTQDSKTLTISRTNANGETKTVLTFGGSESKNGNLVSRAKWDGSKLVVVDNRDMDGTIVTRTTTWWLEGSLLKMQVKTVESAGGGAPTNELITTATYKKS